VFLNCNIDFLLAYVFLSEQEQVDETSDVIAIINGVIREVTVWHLWKYIHYRIPHQIILLYVVYIYVVYKLEGSED
jgi:hypothetical protein